MQRPWYLLDTFGSSLNIPKVRRYIVSDLKKERDGTVSDDEDTHLAADGKITAPGLPAAPYKACISSDFLYTSIAFELTEWMT